MCGRFVSISNKKEIEEEFEIESFDSPIIKSYNIAPSQIAGVIINDHEKKYLSYRWGLIPSWSKDTKIDYKMINSRAETITEKISFKYAFKRRRCLIPTNGFYEWKKERKEKTPYFIHTKSKKLFSFGGIWESWKDADGNNIYTFSIITTKANEVLKQIHDRSPVIIPKEKRAIWLDKDSDYEELKKLLVPYNSEKMKSYPVSKFVNNPENNSEKCIEELV